MRRTLLAAAAVLALVPPPAQAVATACVYSDGTTVCSESMRCLPFTTIRITIVGAAKGSVSCGGATAGCVAFRGFCTAEAQTTHPGQISCSITGGKGVAVCGQSVTFK